MFGRVWGEVSGATAAAAPGFQGSPAAYVRGSRASLEAVAALAGRDPGLRAAALARLRPKEGAAGASGCPARTFEVAAVWAHWKLSGALDVLEAQGQGSRGKRGAREATLLTPSEALALASATLAIHAPGDLLEFLPGEDAADGAPLAHLLAAHAAELVRHSFEAGELGAEGSGAGRFGLEECRRASELAVRAAREMAGLSDDIGGSSPRLMRAGGAGASPAGRGLPPESSRDKLLKECLHILGLCLPCLLAPIPPNSAPGAPETSEHWSLGDLVPKAERESASQAFARACNPSMGPTSWRRLTTAAADPVCGLAMYFSAGAVRELEADSWDGGWVRSSPLGAMLQVVAALAGALAAREGRPPLPHADHRVQVKREGGGRPPLKSPGVRVLQYLRTFYSRLLLRHKHGLAAAGQGHLVVRVFDRLALRSGAGSNGGGKGDPLWELPERESLGPLVEFVDVVAARGISGGGRGTRAARDLCAELAPLLGRCRAALRGSVEQAKRARSTDSSGIARSVEGLLLVVGLACAYARLARAARVRPRRCLPGLLELCLLCNQCVFRQAALASRCDDGSGDGGSADVATAVKSAVDRTERLAQLVGLSQEALPPRRAGPASEALRGAGHLQEGSGGAVAGGVKRAAANAGPGEAGAKETPGRRPKKARGGFKGAPRARRRKKKRRTSTNAYIDAVLAFEAGGARAGDLEDLEDFIVCKSGRDYSELLSRGHSTL